MNISTWKLDCSDEHFAQLIDIIKNTKKQLYILDTSKTTFSLVEKYVYDVANYHFSRLGLDINDKFVEFWFKGNITMENNRVLGINQFHVDCDEEERARNNVFCKPLLSCVSYFNKCNFPTIITEVGIDDYKFKEFNHKNNIGLVFPEERKQVTFDGTNFHGVLNIFNESIDESINESIDECNPLIDRLMFAINLWDKKPLDISFFDSNNTTTSSTFTKEPVLFSMSNSSSISDFKLIKNKEKVFNYKFYESMLYNKNNFVMPNAVVTSVKEVYDSLSVNEPFSANFLITDEFDEKEIIFSDKKKAFEKFNSQINLINGLESFTNEQQNIFYNRFIQRFTYNNIFGKNVCEWFIAESENYARLNGGWTTQRHHNYPTTDLPLEKITSIFGFTLFSFNNIFDRIKKSYCLPDYLTFNISDLFVVKYDSDMQNSLEMHHDGSFFSMNILLSDTNDFEGGGTYFNDGITSYLNQGDLLVHSGKVKHSGLTITKGNRYVLIAFVNILITLDKDLL
jgi:hypothetical protein